MALPQKILLIDDDEAFNFLNRLIITGLMPACIVYAAQDGQAALNIIKRDEGCPDVILLDINMPGMDGFEFLDEFDKLNKCSDHTKIFMLTSSSRDEDRVNVLSHKSVIGYLSKPLTVEHIEEILLRVA